MSASDNDLSGEWEAAGDDPSVNLLLRTIRNLLREGSVETALYLLGTAIALSEEPEEAHG